VSRDRWHKHERTSARERQTGRWIEVKPLTALSQTAGTAPDSGVLSGHSMDPDLRKQTSAHWPDVRHETTDQKVGGSSPSERAQVTGPLLVQQRAFLLFWEPRWEPRAHLSPPRSRTHRPPRNPRPLRRPSRHPRAAPALRPAATTRTTRPRRTIRRTALADAPALRYRIESY
jgi:hypothetical protein